MVAGEAPVKDRRDSYYVRMTLRHKAERRVSQIMIMNWELQRWIEFARRYRFSVELERVDDNRDIH